MKVALITYEYPPDTANGGIATYSRQEAMMMQQHGQEVEVFAASLDREGTTVENEVTVHRVIQSRYDQFRHTIAPVFQKRHAEVGFDVVETAEFNADAYEVLQLCPDLALVVKLHTPTFMITEFNSLKLDPLLKARLYLGAVRRGRKPFWHYDHTKDVEYHQALQADEIVAPCKAIQDLVAQRWSLDTSLITRIPILYHASEALLSVPLGTDTKTITFLGRLEVRKGVLDLMKAVPMVLAKHPDWKFRFIGRPLGKAPDPNLDMRQYMEQGLQRYRDSVEFVGEVKLPEIPKMLARTDICVYPSIWENFPSVCLEAMAAGRAIVGSSAGGMADMLDGGKYGKVVPPQQPRQIAAAINALIEDPQLRLQLGKTARERAVAEYNFDRIFQLQIASYQRAVERRRAKGPRVPSDFRELAVR